jgi:hypothetical protein
MYRRIAYRDLLVHKSLVSGNSRYAELRLSGILCHVFLLFGRLRSLREIAYRDFLMQRFYTPQISDERNPDAFQDVDTCPAEING